MSKDQKDFVRINERIRFSPVRVIGQEGNQLGILPTRQALEIARQQSLDLVEIAPQARPPVCRIMDYGKYKYEQGIKQKEAKQKQKSVQMKEIRFRPNTGVGDIDTKRRAIQKFLEEGHRVQLRIKFERREIAHKDLGFKLLSDIIESLKPFSKPVHPPKMEGRDITCILQPMEPIHENRT